MTVAGVLQTMAANVAAVGARGRITVEVGPFRAFLSPVDDDQLMSFAVPVATPRDWGLPIAALREVFGRTSRTLRLEAFAELHPGLASALELAGFERRSGQPAMVVSGATLRPRRLASSAAFRLLEPNDTRLLVGLLDVQQVSFGMPLDAAGALEWRRYLEQGLADGVVMAGLSTVDGRPACCACLQIGGGSAELSGVATRPGFRRRGLASGLCSRLLATYFARGFGLAWLAAGDDTAAAVYRRLGFQAVGTHLNYGLARPRP